jgi:hypothetical protein
MQIAASNVIYSPNQAKLAYHPISKFHLRLCQTLCHAHQTEESPKAQLPGGAVGSTQFHRMGAKCTISDGLNMEEPK